MATLTRGTTKGSTEVIIATRKEFSTHLCENRKSILHEIKDGSSDVSNEFFSEYFRPLETITRF
jgi:hypothetical protein